MNNNRIAVFAGGWGGEYLQEVVDGISKVAKEKGMDVFAFINFAVPSTVLTPNIPEFNLFTLPDLTDFDGVLLMANSFNMQEEIEYLSNKILKNDIPAVSIEYAIDGIPSITTDNYSGMYELVDHIMTEHGVKQIVYVSGPENHVESRERLRAVCEAATERGHSIPKENILYSDWSKNPTIKLVDEWMKKHDNLPDAFVCANDIMAMAVCEFLQEQGIRVPGNVIVTGYDCLKAAQEFHPVMTTVSNEWDKMGERATYMLLKQINGGKAESEIIGTKLITGESCGCTYKDYYHEDSCLPERIRLNLKTDWLAIDSHFRHIYIAIRKAENSEELNRSLTSLFTGDHLLEGEDFMMCLDPEFFRIEEKDTNLKTQGYNTEFDVVCHMRNCEGRQLERMSRKRAIFGLAAERAEPMLYTYVPLYSDTKTYGFAILTKNIYIACENQLYVWTRHLNQYLEQVRRNITIAELTKKLTQQSVTDALTGVYNRAGCEKMAYPMLEEWRKNGGTGVIFIIDVDKMKDINDKYGHASGDLALRTVASVLISELSSDWIVSRFGGDEFFVGGKAITDEIDLKSIEERLELKLQEKVENLNIKFPLTMSIGSVKLRPGDDTPIEKLLGVADSNMYSEKDIHHSKILDEIKKKK